MVVIAHYIFKIFIYFYVLCNFIDIIYSMHNQADLVFLIESTGFIGVCFDQIKEKYISPILQSLWGYNVKDEIGVINDVIIF